jgi:hypothetical protein
VVVDGSTLFECSQEECGHIFPYPGRVDSEEEKDPQDSSPEEVFTSPAPSELSVQDSQDEPPEEIFVSPIRQVSGKSAHAASPAPHKPFPHSPVRDEADEEIEDLSSLEDPLLPEENLYEGHSSAFSFNEPDFPSQEQEEQIIPRRMRSRTRPDMTVSLKPVLFFLASIVAGYGCLYAYFLVRPAAAETLLANIPLLGSVFAADQFSAHQISLSEIQGNFQTTKDNRQVFVISGKATNDAPVPVYGIQLEGHIYDEDGQQVGAKTIACGTETNPAVLPNLTVHEIGILQNLTPPKHFNVSASQSIRFLIVFTSPPPNVAGFSSRVTTARFVAS